MAEAMIFDAIRTLRHRGKSIASLQQHCKAASLAESPAGNHHGFRSAILQ
jgi:hypothetical protein